jgi:hypothetical protein
VKIEFIGTLQGSRTIVLDDDNAGQIKITYDGSQWHRIVHLSAHQRKALKITIDTQDTTE